MTIGFEAFAVLTLATFYIALAVTSTHGVAGSFEWMRSHVPHGGLLTCFICFSFWVALVLYALLFQRVELVEVFAIAGAASALHGWVM